MRAVARRGVLLFCVVLLGCGPGTVTRVVDGEMLEGRAIPPDAYAAYAKAPGFQWYWKERRDTFRPEFREFIDGYGSPEVSRWGEMRSDSG